VSWFCTACAAANPSAERRCRACGEPRREISPGRAASRSVAPRPASGAGILLAIAPLLVLLAVVGAYRRAERAEQARHYAQAEVALAAGDPAAAIAAFGDAGDHRDAAARRAVLAADLAPVDDAFRRGRAALDAGRHDEAVAALETVVASVPAYAGAAEGLAEARRLRREGLLRRANDAEAARDWLAAEAALAALATSDPTDADLAERLAALRRAHAPLAVARDGALWLVGPDGADERLVTDAAPVTRPVWSPDRTRLAFVSPTAGDAAPAALFVVGADGRGLRRLSDAAHPSAVAAWSPDGARIAYTSVAAYDPATEDGLLAVHVVEVDSGRDQDLTGGTGRHAVAPAWAPGGDRLAVVSRPRLDRFGQDALDGPGDVLVFPAGGGAPVDLTTGRVPDVARAVWSPAGDRLLVFARPSRDRWTTGAADRLFELDPASGRLDPVAADVDAASAAWAPAWAPDGARYAYVAGPAAVVVREADGRQTRIPTERALSGALTWAPGGAALLAAAADPRQPSVAIDLGPDGPTVSDLPIPYDADWPTGTPQWSPVLPAG
jgi:Tol biopolymer transport system component